DDEHGDTADGAEREAGRGDEVAVPRGQRARGERREQLAKGRGHQPRQRTPGDHGRLVRQAAGDELAEEPRKERHDERRGDRDRCEGDDVRAELSGERAQRGSAREIGDDDHPKRLSPEHEHEVDAVRRHEAVGAHVAAELVGEHRPGDGCRAADGEKGEPGQHSASNGAPAALRATLPLLVRGHRRMKSDRHDAPWTDGELADLQRDVGEFFAGRTCLVTGADGFMGSHLTDALVHLDANVHAFVRGTSSGALNNIGHLWPNLKVHFADLTDRTSVDYLVKELLDAPDRPYVFHLGAQAHVGESWHRPYETVLANTIGTLNLLQSIVDHGLELEKFDTAGTSEEYGNVREAFTDQHDFDPDGGVVFHERSPINPKSVYATSKVAADFLTMNYYDAYGVPGVVTRMFNNYGPRQNPRYVTGTIITQALVREQIELGNLEPLRDFCFCTDG